MNYHNITHCDLKNGPGIREVVWVSGCEHHCDGCHNPETWDLCSGIPWDETAEQELFDALEKDKEFLTGVTFSGGDPMHPANRGEVFRLCKKIKDSYPQMDICIYTGYLYGQLVRDPEVVCGLRYVNLLIDGPFVRDLCDLDLHYRGSTNQHIIEVQKSIERGYAVCRYL